MEPAVELGDALRAAVALSADAIASRATLDLDIAHAATVIGSHEELAEELAAVLAQALDGFDPARRATNHLVVRTVVMPDERIAVDIARCRVILPLAAPVVVAVRRKPPTSDAACVLLVDDDAQVLRSLPRLLACYRVLLAASVDDALRALACERVDVIVCDVNMPRRSGVELVREAAERWPGIDERVVLMTGALVKDVRIPDGLRPTLLAKPFGATALREAIDEVSKRRS